MSSRPLALVSGLTLGDYILWNWSLNANHDVLALVSGLTLPPLALACLAMLVLSLLRVIGSSTRRPGRGTAAAVSRVAADGDASERNTDARAATAAGGGREGSPAPTGSSPSSSGKIAA